MYRLTSAKNLRALFAATAAAATYSSRRCFAESPPPPATDEFVNVGEKSKIRGETLAENACKRKELPPNLLSENVAMLTCESSADGGICNVYLIGTCHDSPESRREVKDVIRFLKPEIVFMELCPSRFTVMHTVEGRSIVQSASTLHEKPDLDGMRVVQGAESEFVEAYMLAMQYGAKVILGDRPIEITMKRMADKISVWDTIKLKYYTMFQDERFTALWTSLDPAFDEVLVQERDSYMSAKILEVAREHNLVVCVVGEAHLPGIKKNWKQPVELERLLSVPTERFPFAQLLILDSVAAAVVAGAVIIFRKLSKK